MENLNNNYILKKTIFFLVLLHLTLINSSAFAFQDNLVLVVHSHDEEYGRTHNVYEAIGKTLADLRTEVRVVTEFIDSSRINIDFYYFDTIRRSFFVKYSDDVPDVIVTIENDALNFVYSLRDSLFNDIPIVFVNMLNFKDKIVLDNLTTGIYEKYDYDGLVKEIIKLQPNIKKIVFIGDSYFEMFHGFLEAEISEFIKNNNFKNVDIELLDGVSLNELVERFKGKSDVAAIVMSASKNNSEIRFVKGINKFLFNKARIPLYTFYSESLETGSVIGGKVLSCSKKGEIVGDYVLKLLEGKDIKELPLVSSDELGRWVFDFNLLKNFNIDIKKLPNDSFILNAPDDQIHLNKKFVYTFIFILIISASGFLIYSYFQKRHKQVLMLYKMVLEYTYDIIFITNFGGDVIEVYGNVENTFGFKEDEIREMNLNELYYSKVEKDKFLANFKESGKLTNYITFFKNKSGDKLIFESSAISFRMDNEDRIFIILRDITDKLEREEELKFFGYLIEQSPVLISVMDVDGRIIYANKHFLLYNGHEVGKQCIFFNKHSDEIRQQLDENGFWSGEIENVKTDGSRYTESSIISKTNFKGKDVYVKFGIDITEYKKIKDKMIAQQKFETLGQLAGGIAHDFNNILTVISSYLQVYQMKVDREYDKKIFNKMMEAVDKASSLISQLLAFSRQDSHQPVVINVSKYLVDSIDMYRRLIREDIELILDRKTKEVILKVDPVHLDQMFLNMINNSVYALEHVKRDHKYIKITIDKKNFHDERSYGFFTINKGKYAEIIIEDNGTGIDESIVDKIFEPFFTTKPRGKGTGLGLASIYGFIKRNNGYIIVDTKKGEYTKFIIYLPLFEMNMENKQELMNTNEKINLLRDKHVVVIDDNKDLAHSVGAMLSRFCKKVEVFDNPLKAKDYILANKNDIDLVISDITMPEMSGVELVNNLKKEGVQFPIVLMTGYGVEEFRSGTISVPVISKPFSLDNLLKHLL
ncbi:ABC transporter substrate binding protein [Deferribacter abyssi]|uniref:ABC transporter substrate binding protein n=1 Tax=Deferribacter abyssi TaxID=213806 RepID=UPI003C159045